jgi:TIR domain
MTTIGTKPVIFISYAHADEPEKPRDGEEKWLSFVTGHLQPAVKHGDVDIWVDTLMRGGDDWNPEIERKLRECHVLVLLVSRYSISSDYVVDKEIAIIRERQKNGEDVRLYPLLLTPTADAGLGVIRDKNLRPRGGRPFSSYAPNDRDQHMADAANEIAKIAAEIATGKKMVPQPRPRPLVASDAEPPERSKRFLLLLVGIVGFVVVSALVAWQWKSRTAAAPVREQAVPVQPTAEPKGPGPTNPPARGDTGSLGTQPEGPKGPDGPSTSEIVREIRCETAEAGKKLVLDALVKWTDPGFTRSAAASSVSQNILKRYDSDRQDFFSNLNPDKEFTKESAGENAQNFAVVLDSIYSLGLAYAFDLSLDPSGGRNKQVAFATTDTIRNLFTDVAKPGGGDPSYCDGQTYLIVGKIGIYKILYDFLNLAIFSNFAANPTPLVDQLSFTTTIDVSPAPKVVFAPIDQGFRASEHSLLALRWAARRKRNWANSETLHSLESLPPQQRRTVRLRAPC